MTITTIATNNRINEYSTIPCPGEPLRKRRESQAPAESRAEPLARRFSPLLGFCISPT